MDLTGVELIAEERRRQIEEEGWDEEHDIFEHNDFDLALAGAAYAFMSPSDQKRNPPPWWPFSDIWWKPTPNDPVRQLVKAGALIAAEIDRIQKLK